MKLRLNNRTARDDQGFSSGFSPQISAQVKQTALWRCRRLVLFVLLLACWSVLTSDIVLAQVPTKRVLIISGYDPTRPAFQIINRAIRTAIRDGVKGPVEFFNEFQDNARSSNHQYDTEMVSFVGGSLLDFEALGRRNEVGVRTLAGENVQKMPPQTVLNATLFDWRELRRWGISEQRLPTGSVVQLKLPAPWELYKWYIIGIIAASLVQTALILWLLFMRAKRRQAERQSQRFGLVAGAEHKRLEEVVANVPGIVWESRIDSISGETKAMFVSEYAEKMLGYSAQELMSTPRFVPTLIHEEDHEKVLREFQAVRAGKEGQVIQYRCKAKDGRVVWVESNLAPIIDVDGTIVGVRSVTLDITNQKLAEEARGQSEERSSAILQAIPDLMFLQTRDGVYLDYSTPDQGELLVSPKQFLGKNMRDVLPPQLADQFLRCFERAERGETQVLEYQLPINGKEQWYEARIVRSGDNILSVVRDITERKRAEEALHQANNELNRLKHQLEAENIYLQHELHMDQRDGEILGKSDAIKYVLFKISQVAPTDSTVLITGETGTGKELVARAIHEASRRKERPLVKVNCAALSPTLIESELFGHEKGAFTGAEARKLGRFELANTGTLFLDEIGELPPELQVKLLRVLQEGEFERLGGTKTLGADVRIIAATNRNLKLEVAKGNFREDLWYRLNVFPITLPPLRARKEDIPLLVNHFVKRAAKKTGKTITSVSAVTMRNLQEHTWPGNVRELANVIERAVIHALGTSLQVVDRFEQISEESTPPKTLEEIEREYILRILESTGWRIEGPDGAARVLGLNASTLRTRMSKLGIQRRQATHA